MPWKNQRFQKKSANLLYWKFAESIGDDQLDALATIKSKEELIEKSLDYFNHQQRVISALQNRWRRRRHNNKTQVLY
jgi:large subunit ribosomal protein L10